MPCFVNLKYALQFIRKNAKLSGMIINEIFYSVQGEGSLVGVPSIFIRFAGCDLRCKWCDTKYAWKSDSGKPYTMDELFAELSKYPAHHVVITGGEPFLCDELSVLCDGLKANDVHVTIETAGTKYIEGVKCDLMSISPKLANSFPDDPALAQEHKQNCFDAAMLQKLIDNYNYQLKFVVDGPGDLNDIAQTLAGLDNLNPDKVYLMPQATGRDEYIEKSKFLVEVCKQTSFAFSPRLQVVLYNREKGK